MIDEMKLLLEDAQERMVKAVEHLDRELGKIRAGKANPKMLDSVRVDYYGAPTPLANIASVSTADSKTIAITPWEKNMIGPIEKAIINSNLGFNPDNNGEIIRIHIPPLTEERRKDLMKQVKFESEESRVRVRSIRREVNDELKKMKKEGLSEDLEKDAEAETQKLTDKYIKVIDEMYEKKEKEIFTV